MKGDDAQRIDRVHIHTSHRRATMTTPINDAMAGVESTAAAPSAPLDLLASAAAVSSAAPIARRPLKRPKLQSDHGKVNDHCALLCPIRRRAHALAHHVCYAVY